MAKRIFNFSAGPATLPLSVLEQVQAELLDFQGSGMSLMEMSHRGKIFDAVYKDSIERLRRIAAIPDDFDILYMTGGASTQFTLIPLNLKQSGKAGYINTGAWSKKAMGQAKILNMAVNELASSAESNHNHIPQIPAIPADLDYVHLTSNNTIFGTQFSDFPQSPVPLCVDMSSDFLSRPIDWSKMSLVYAGMQKNAGPAGVTVVILRKDLYARESAETPTIWRYSTFGENESMYNTPPTFQIYIFGLILKWIEDEMGGLQGVAAHNQKKAQAIYNVIDQYPDFFVGHARKDSRSLMNITWNYANADLNPVFVQESEANGMSGLKGHRSVGGLRASIYNAMSLAGCEELAQRMLAFHKQHA
ncbi:MAG: 3-phosphoserine/phosphohydroxythreonine transaminase [Leptospiraceae bacterium]|nr:3-phosphoserine/phosphohydroxythreonine transaminase [Leptospiraceae bacterium]